MVAPATALLSEMHFPCSQQTPLLQPSHEPRGALLRAAVQVDERLTAAVRKPLDLAPGDAADAGAERFHYVFLRGEARGQLRHAPATERDLLGRVDAPQEAPAMAVDDGLHAR